MLAGHRQRQGFTKRAAPSLLGISFGVGQGRREQEEECAAVGVCDDEGREREAKPNKLIRHRLPEECPLWGISPPPALTAWPGGSWIRFLDPLRRARAGPREDVRQCTLSSTPPSSLAPLPLFLLPAPEINNPGCPPSPKDAFWAAPCPSYLSGYQEVTEGLFKREQAAADIELELLIINVAPGRTRCNNYHSNNPGYPGED